MHALYAGSAARAITALSQPQIASLRAGRGMGLALASEVNGYPGPMHVLQFADSLDLSDQQRAKMEELITAMKAEAIPLGEQLIVQEADLDKQFANRTINTGAIGATHAALRRAHLKYHLFTVEVLTPAQVQRHAELRGYSGAIHLHGHRE